MIFNSLNPIKRYTPPTCILEIYQENSLISLSNSNDDFQPINFQLHFDDPRSLHEDKFIIKGDKNLLKILREKINNYLLNYVENKISDSSEKNQPQFALNSVNNSEILIQEKGLCCHQLSYFADNQQIINLTNTQLFDLANALENYHLESTSLWQQQKDNQRKNLFLLTAILGVISLLGGLWWWQNQKVIGDTATLNDSVDLNNNSIESNVEDVIPPSPLDPNTIPPIITPTESEAMKNRATLPPPPATLTQPPINPSAENNGQTTISLNPPQNNNILPPPQAPSLPPPSPSPVIPNENIIAIQPSPLPTNSQTTLPQTPATPTVSIPKIDSPPQLSSLPVLQSLNSQTVNNSDNQKNAEINRNSPNIDSVNPVAMNQAPNLSNLQSRQNQSVNSQTPVNNYTNPLTQQVQQYFEGKWQPPENLKQSIEYRLLVAENGSLDRVTPLGQVAKIFLDRTGMPLLGESIASSAATESVIIRLILSPNGDVKTFEEY